MDLLDKHLDLLDKHQELRKRIFEYFGYEEDWKVLPLNDSRDYFWWLKGDPPQEVCFSKIENFEDEEKLYCNLIYTQRYLPRWVYRGEAYTMVVVDTQVDGNQFLQIFDNAKERTS